MKQKILSWLLHHGNTGYRCQKFYDIKNMLLDKYGIPEGIDVQLIYGKECISCEGTGIYHGYYGSQYCYRCAGSGMYKDDRIVKLLKIKFGKYSFHKPIQSTILTTYNKDIIHPQPNIYGYITHEKSKYCSLARFILFLVYEKSYLKRWWKETGNGWRVYPFRSMENFICNVVHFIKKGRNAYPLRRLKDKIKHTINRHRIINQQSHHESEELPF